MPSLFFSIQISQEINLLIASDEFEQEWLRQQLLTTNRKIKDIAYDLNKSVSEIESMQAALGLSWISHTRSISKGQSGLASIMAKLLPGETIEQEVHIGKRLRLDVYCARFKLAAEYHGRQHYEFIPHFHKDKYGFVDMLQRDRDKASMCEQKGIVLVVFGYNEQLIEQIVFDRMMAAIKNAPGVPEPQNKFIRNHDDLTHKEILEKRRAWTRNQYRKQAERNKIYRKRIADERRGK